MKNKIFKNRFFYATLVLAALILIQTARFVYGEMVPGWRAPTAPPTGGQPAAPIDTSGASQIKLGTLSVGPDSGNAVSLSNADRQVLFTGNSGSAQGAIRFNPDTGNMEYRNNDGKGFFPIGSGEGGGGESLWKSGTDGIFYDGGKVGIGSSIINTNSNSGSLQITSPVGSDGGILILPKDKMDFSAVKFFVGSDVSDPYFYISRGGVGESQRYNAFIIDTKGRVGIGAMPSTSVDSPAILKVSGGAEFTDSAVFSKNVTIQGNVNISGLLTGGRLCPEKFTFLEAYGTCVGNKVELSGTEKSWHDASQYCANSDTKGRLCSYKEWYSACVDKLEDVVFTNIYEFFDDFTGGDSALVAKKSSEKVCKDTSEKSITDTYSFRCCLY